MSWTRRPLFWAAYALLALVSGVVAWHLFPQAIPLVNLDIKLSRQGAIDQARALAALHSLAQASARSAARFSGDPPTQNYVELEGGGKSAFARLVAGELYSPYKWDVRLFEPGVIAEAMVRFRPDGKAIGFERRVAESYVRDPARQALDAMAAQALAEERARIDWDVDLAPYRLLEQAQERRPSGRVDHRFVYERAEKLGEARIRLRLAVAGDEFVGMLPYVHIPESFARRFQEMRSANNTIAGVAGVTAGLLYGVGGCILAVLWLARHHWLLVRPALAAGMIVAGLMAASTLAAAPAAWFGFDTAGSTLQFWLRQIGIALALALVGGLGYALVFMAAESLARRAFPHQPQLWQIWSRTGGATTQALGRTLGGYLFVPLELALIAAFYYATNRWFGWWQPSEVLTDPNILSSALPALAPIAISLQAGFMEECVFRAIPLALGALIGARFGRRTLGIAIAMALQAIVFGAAHANYPGLPSYARLVELFVPSILWGLIFLRYGLLPTILLHALFDLVLFAIPVFLVDAPGAWVQQGLVVAAGLVPLAIVLARRFRAGAFHEQPSDLWNGAWQPAPRSAEAEAPAAASAEIANWARRFQRALPALALAGGLAWIAGSKFSSDVPPLNLTRAQALAAADAALGARASLGPDWQRSAMPRRPDRDESASAWHAFVWREAGPDAYRRLAGEWLAPPLWEIRYARFEGEVAERAEEWRLSVAGDGRVRQVRHALPEARPGASLDRAAALALAQRELRERFGLDPELLTPVGAQDARRPARTDWEFTFADPRVAVGPGGEARVAVRITGDEVASSGRYVHVPEEWLRAQRQREGRNTLVKIAAAIALAGAGVAALVIGVVGWTKGRCDRRALVATLLVALIVAVATNANGWPSVAMSLRTAEPVGLQLTLAILGALATAIIGALVYAFATGVGAWSARASPRTPLAGILRPWSAGGAAALVAAGVAAAILGFAPREAPTWPSLELEGQVVPWVGAITSGAAFLLRLGTALFALHVLERVTAHWTRWNWLAGVILVLLYVATALGGATDAIGALATGTVAGLVATVLVFGLFRYDARTVIGYLAVTTLLDGAAVAAQKGVAPAWGHYAASAATCVAIAWVAYRYVTPPLAGAPEEIR